MLTPIARETALHLLADQPAGTVVTAAALQRLVSRRLPLPPSNTLPWREFLAQCARVGRVRGQGRHVYVVV